MSISSSTRSNARYVVLFFAILLAVITYVDRVCISNSRGQIQSELGLEPTQMGWVFFSFSMAYALFEIPGGWLGDRFGPRVVLMRIVCMWSIFTIATGFAWNFWSLIVFRFIFGVGEAGCFPNLTKIFTNWFPASERVRAQGILWLSARWGGAFTPLLVGWMLAKGGDGNAGLGLHYSNVFLIFGVVGMLWAALFYRWFRNDPKDHPSVNAAELAHIGHTDDSQDHAMPWGKLFGSPNVWLIWGQYFFMSFSWYFYITWFPKYLKDNFQGESEMMLAFLACFPLFFGGLGSLISGLCSSAIDRALKSTALTRRVLGVVGLCLAASMLLISIQLNEPILIVLAIGLASFFNDIAMPGAWGVCMDIGGRYAGALSGSMNMMGNLGGALAPLAVPYVLEWSNDNWDYNIYLFATSYFLGAVCWLFINSNQRFED